MTVICSACGHPWEDVHRCPRPTGYLLMEWSNEDEQVQRPVWACSICAALVTNMPRHDKAMHP